MEKSAHAASRNPVRKPASLRQIAASQSSIQTLARHGLAAGISAAMLMPLCATAQTDPTAQAQGKAAESATFPTIQVVEKAIDPNPNAEVGAPYKAKTSGDSRHTRPLAETPQTIQVVTAAAIADSGQTDLKQILSSQPGITLGTGENGNMFGDNFVIRGQSAKSDVFVDGLRDPGMSTRESFAIEQVEITKGPNSSFAGRGSAGGAINAITKQATLDYNFTRVNLGVGTDSYQRYTADINKAIGDNAAVRINALWADQDVPDRDPASRARKGLAISGLYEASKDFSITLDYYGARGKDDYPDTGSYLVGNQPYRRPTESDVVGAQDGDFMKSDIDTGTARIRWNIAPEVTLNSLTRYGTTNNSYAFWAPQYNTNAQAATIQTHSRWQDVKYFAHQDNLRWDTNLFGRKNESVFTLEYTDHQVDQGGYTAANALPFNCRTATGSGTNNAYCVTVPGSGIDGATIANPNSITGTTWARGGKNYDWHVKTVAASAMDTVDLTDRFTAFGGLRLDRILDFTAKTLNASTGAITGDYQYEETLRNGWAGLSYKVAPDGIVYAAYGTGQDINGGEPDSGTAAGYGGLVTVTGVGVVTNAKPETSKNWELGTKWNLLDHKLLATAAVFRTDKSNVMEATSQAEYAVDGTTNTGANRVQGVELGLVGNVTDNFSLQAGAAFMKSKITKANAANASLIGHPLANFANQSSSLQGKYQPTRDFDFGGTVRHDSRRCGGQPDTGVAYDAATGLCAQPVKGFTVLDLFANYRINKHLQLHANVLNAGDKEYYTAVYRGGFFLYKGDARRFTIAIDMEL
ncbi:MAG: TonB-dependent receptor [Proteobacteria bacterium]|nr:TonB-dependent receptor [Pseudomonadota bacterium]